MDELVDLRTGKAVRAAISADDQLGAVVARPGALVRAGGDGVLARFTDGTRKRLDTAPAEALAVTGARGCTGAPRRDPRAPSSRSRPPSRRCRARTRPAAARHAPARGSWSTTTA
jgi:hypothetical protein